ncbi:putative rev7 putativemitotic spindle checkpoint component [Leptomonas pyrrhocoris]|uniref:Putative rev7 putativemitotic spindle checkpoint component n=1 Tax=Leptomonas pyrrhocoris TaxID=157538 RepID=A0A0N0DUZ6_LEPPY|nr:putative rev7 putativemitotic spindle checkpoint component [Leptomonas pyrrhocoris]KPA79662.1 putative rev7 putativemitotic spindle checkpoint component [Leptomonas pyrrhocoris]|eukprot:XP_015658101.1 putative rev7 putativemitotic spindle checkpoint component [Leptomonas pyrrhocoris]
MTQTAHAISLSGSVATVTEYVGFAINNILYQRGVYPPEDFQQVKKYGLGLMISTDGELNAYLSELLQQISLWITHGSCRRLVLLITDVATERALERWEINIEAEPNATTAAAAAGARRRRPVKSEDDVRREIQAVMRQITACVSFLPVIPVPCAFDLLVYTSTDAQVPSTAWEPSDPQVMKGGTEVKLRSFTTTIHHVDTNIVYRE